MAGWVRNRLDGSVEAEVIGPAPAVEAVIAWARRGPPYAAVTAVEVAGLDATSDPQLPTRVFEQRPTV